MTILACAGAFPGAGLDAVRAQEAARQDVIVVGAIADAARAREATARPIRVALAESLSKDPGIVASEIAGAVRAGAAEVALDARAQVAQGADKLEVLARVLEAVRPAAGEARLVLDVAVPLDAATFQALQALPVDVLHVDATADGAIAALLGVGPARKALSLGLVTGARAAEEKAARLRRAIEDALPKIAPHDCYLASRDGLAALPPKRAAACAAALAKARDALARRVKA